MEIRRLWRKILLAYTEANLTVNSDKLAALSGVISAIERSTGWRNIAGLWEPTLIEDLLWSIVDIPSKSPPSEQRSQALPGPSWSWVFVSRSIIESIQVLPNDVKLLAYVEEVDYSIFANGAGTDGSAMIHISCMPMKVISCKLEEIIDPDYEFYSNYSSPRANRHLVQLADWPGDRELFFSSDLCSGEKRAQLFTPLLEAVSRNSLEIFGLFLAPSDHHPGAYERVGIGAVHCLPEHVRLSPMFSEPSKRQIVTLV